MSPEEHEEKSMVTMPDLVRKCRTFRNVVTDDCEQPSGH
jgi:hypothetical protein